jgi:HNH endonuclease
MVKSIMGDSSQNYLDLATLALSPITEKIELQRQASIWLRREAEEWYIRERQRFRDSRLVLEPVILKPVCEDCSGRFGTPLIERLLRPHGLKSEIITLVLPTETTPQQLRIYDRSNRLLHMWDYEDCPPDWWQGIECDWCSQQIETGDGDNIVVVTEEPFAEYFGLPEPQDAPKKLRGKAKREMQARLFGLYGGRCFECKRELNIGKNLTLDHIEPQSLGGPSLATNLQPFCDDCQQKKGDLPAETVVVALDMNLRPPPSDAYSGLVW